ncbi:hypothetical protein [Natronolimnobius baerhuensis]|uniref:CopG family transcriptional regulator n=1 Tax=Natronolimnobius baerhuensis TaxID=253108 RepID=A0A202EC01_9EURY|nr:hypothetical protein [Natronolimnobius baerhuensis]OVE85718.1 hypothetical protein B2G88_02555 [Natronolimnobius baerhuensis]
MASENDDGGVSFALPAEVDAWVAETAEQRDESREEICRRVVTAAHAIATDDESVPVDQRELEDLEEQVEADLESHHEEFHELLEDVRSRVIQVKREADAKAPADHDHAEYEDDIASMRTDLTDLEDHVSAGFENFEDVLDYLFDQTDDLEERSTVLATAVVDLRDRWNAVAERERRRAAVERLQLAANQLGIRAAACEDCDASVDIALLTAPECPHCASSFADVTERTSFFGSHILETGEPPALEGQARRETQPTSDEVFEELESDAETTRDRNSRPSSEVTGSDD